MLSSSMRVVALPRKIGIDFGRLRVHRRKSAAVISSVSRRPAFSSSFLPPMMIGGLFRSSLTGE
jgi:hypothetical protein